MFTKFLSHRRRLARLVLAFIVVSLSGFQSAPVYGQLDSPNDLVTPSEDPEEVAEILIDLSTGEIDPEHRYLLHPANTSSPRDTIVSFIKLTQRFYDIISSDDYSPGDRAEVLHLFGEIQDFFDLRNIPPSLREDYASAAGIYVREVIDRVGLPPYQDIPGEQAMRNAILEGQPARWQLPGLPFEIIRVNSGPDEGRYLFSEETLRMAESVFTEIRFLPYRTTAAEDFYYYFFLTPNPIIPAAWINALPPWMLKDYFEQTVWQWLSMFLVLIFGGLSVFLLRALFKALSRKRSRVAKTGFSLFIPIWAIIVSLIAYDLIDDKIFITGDIFQGVTYLISLVVLTAAIFFFFILGSLVSDLVTGSSRFHNRSFDSHLIRIGIRIGSIIICIAILIQGLHFIGFSLATVIAGAGVTGLAVALAAQSTLRNIFGSLMILLDKPFRVGQRIVVGDHDGVVEEIGLRSTRLRLLNGHVTSIPNERVADLEIENIGLRPFIKRVSSIHLTYGTPLDKINRAVSIIRETLTEEGKEKKETEESQAHLSLEHINRAEFPPRVFFDEFNEDSLNILMIYWYHPAEYWDFLAFGQWINEEIIRRFREEGIEFAFPTQTVQIESGQAAPFPTIAPEPGSGAL